MSFKTYRFRFLLAGLIAGMCAPAGWILIAVLAFRGPGQGIGGYLAEFFLSNYNTSLVLYFCTSIGVLGALAYAIGYSRDNIVKKSSELEISKNEAQKREQEYKYTLENLRTKTNRLLEASKKIQQASSIYTVMEEVARCAYDILEFDRVNIFLTDEKKNRLSCVVTYGTKDPLEKIWVPNSYEGGMLFRAVHDNKTYLVKDINEYPDDFHLHAPFNNIDAFRTKSFFVLPFNMLGKPIGAMNVDNKYKKKIASEDELAVLTMLAQQVSQAITNIYFIDSINKVSTELENTFKMILSQKEKQAEKFSRFTEIITEINTGYASLNMNMHNLFQSLERGISSTAQIHSSIAESSGALKNLYKSTEELATAAFEMRKLAEEISQGTKQTLAGSAKLSDKAEDGAVALNKIYDFIENVKGTLEISKNLFEKFRQTIQGVYQIVLTITSITEQTNLLSLNASVIASQAGEFGKPFSVVANEIKSLSERTKSSAQEIRNIVDDLRSESEEVLAIVEKTYQMVDQGINVATKARGIYQDLKDGAEKSYEMNGKIEKAVEDQHRGINYISRATDEIKDSTMRISTAGDEQEKGSNQIVQSNEEIRILAEDVLKANDAEADNFKRIVDMVEHINDFTVSMFKEIEARSDSITKLIEELKIYFK